MRSFLDHTFFKFILVGILNTVLGSAIMFSLYNFAGFNYWLSSALNYFFTSIFSFFMNRYFTFQIKNWSLVMVLFFVLTIIVSYFVAYSIARPFIHMLLQNHDQRLRDNISMVMGMCLFTLLNYFGQRFIVFRKRKKDE
jgi:putative flippase GtrA